MHKHKDFILSPIGEILKEVVSANAGIGNGIETYPLSEYVMQSAFLKMTGSQEQKMKCICWELATSDFEYRYDRFKKNPLGECSELKEKSIVYRDLIGQIAKNDSSFDLAGEIDKEFILNSTITFIEAVFSNSNLSTWAEKEYLEFIEDHAPFRINQFASLHTLLETDLQKIYDLLYKHRNRCAHNSLSYQDNLPSLTTLNNKDYKYDNYIMRFALLILIDNIFIDLYRKYIKILVEH